VHRFLDKLVGPSVVQLTLDPIVLFLLLQQLLRQRLTPECASTHLQKVDHGKGVLTMLSFDPQPRLDSDQEWLA
jgi:hypothetical protein